MDWSNWKAYCRRCLAASYCQVQPCAWQNPANRRRSSGRSFMRSMSALQAGDSSVCQMVDHCSQRPQVYPNKILSWNQFFQGLYVNTTAKCKAEGDHQSDRLLLHILHICRGRRGHCPWRIFCHVEKFEMWRQFLCGEISDEEKF